MRQAGAGERGQRIGADIERLRKTLAVDIFVERAAQRFQFGESDGMHRAVQAAESVRGAVGERADFFVVSHIATENRRIGKLLRQQRARFFAGARIGLDAESQRRAFAPHRFGRRESERTAVARAENKNFLLR